MSDLLKPREAVDELFQGRVDVASLARWRRVHIGPPFVRLVGRIYYDRSAVLAWIERNTVRADAAA